MVTLKTMLVNAPQALHDQFIGMTGKMTLIRAIAALRPGALVSTTASAKMALRALANRWLILDAEMKELEAVLSSWWVPTHPVGPYGCAWRVDRYHCRHAHCLRRQSSADPIRGRVR